MCACVCVKTKRKRKEKNENREKHKCARLEARERKANVAVLVVSQELASKRRAGCQHHAAALGRARAQRELLVLVWCTNS